MKSLIVCTYQSPGDVLMASAAVKRLSAPSDMGHLCSVLTGSTGQTSLRFTPLAGDDRNVASIAK